MNVTVSLSATPHGPSAALESVPAVLIRRAAVSLHHSIDGDLRHGRQFHGFVLSLVTVFLVVTAPRRGSHRSQDRYLRQRAYAKTETRRQGNSEGTPARVLTSTRDHAPSDKSSFLLVFRARDFPALPAVRASLLDGKEAVDGSSPSEGSVRAPEIGALRSGPFAPPPTCGGREPFIDFSSSERLAIGGSARMCGGRRPKRSSTCRSSPARGARAAGGRNLAGVGAR